MFFGTRQLYLPSCPLGYMSLLADHNWQLLLEMNSADVRNSPYSTSNFLSCQYDYVVFWSHTEKWRSNFLQCSSALAHDKLIFCNVYTCNNLDAQYIIFGLKNKMWNDKNPEKTTIHFKKKKKKKNGLNMVQNHWFKLRNLYEIYTVLLALWKKKSSAHLSNSEENQF